MIGKEPSTVPASEWQTPDASTRMRTSPGPGSASGFITASNFPGFVIWIALYVALILHPYRAIVLARIAHVGPVDVPGLGIDDDAIRRPAIGEQDFLVRSIGVD